MTDIIRAFIIESLQDMNYSVEGIEDDTELGPGGVDIESVALVELATRVEDRFGVMFTEDEAEELAVLTVGEYCVMVAGRLPAAGAADAATS
ncbi:MAG TPA: hypothetical protein VGG25_05395 [Streptosporangiaceae bacterium]|jgi:acyl carrier protein